MSLSKKLIELQQLYQSYQPLWDDWSQSTDCSLSTDDKYIIQVHSQNDFKVSGDYLFMFFNQYRTITKVITNLKTDYTRFQEWAITKFQFTLIKLAAKQGWAYGFYMEIESLDIPKELNKVLRKFNFRSLNELNESHSDEGFKDSKLFEIVIEFLSVQKKINTVNNVLKKEVA